MSAVSIYTLRKYKNDLSDMLKIDTTCIIDYWLIILLNIDDLFYYLLGD